MRAIRLSRKIHKWVAFVVGVQLFLWALSGFYMVVVSIDTIHGDMLVKNMSGSVAADALQSVSVDNILSASPTATNITLKSLMGRPVYVVREGKSAVLFDARGGDRLSPIDRPLAQEIASYHYAGNGAVIAVTRIESNPPSEIKFFPLPVWRVDFDDAWGSSFYIDTQTGRFMSRRHTLWRVFDFLWMLHIMDYDEREDVNNTLLQVASISGVFLALSGVWLLFYSFKRTEAGSGAS